MNAYLIFEKNVSKLNKNFQINYDKMKEKSFDLAECKNEINLIARDINIIEADISRLNSQFQKTRKVFNDKYSNAIYFTKHENISST
jgi:tRNA1(Val) A37 N6-methylase TrmN6